MFRLNSELFILVYLVQQYIGGKKEEYVWRNIAH